jgi:hypothetical protein
MALAIGPESHDIGTRERTGSPHQCSYCDRKHLRWHSLTSARGRNRRARHRDSGLIACQNRAMDTTLMPEPFPPGPDRDRRVHPRKPLAAAASFRERGRTREDVRVTDLSPAGCRVELKGALICGEHGWVTLPTLAPWSCAVAWRSEEEAGVRFEQPLHEAVAEMIATRHGAG